MSRVKISRREGTCPAPYTAFTPQKHWLQRQRIEAPILSQEEPTTPPHELKFACVSKNGSHCRAVLCWALNLRLSVSEVYLPQIHRLGSSQLGEGQDCRVRGGDRTRNCALGASSSYHYCRVRPAAGRARSNAERQTAAGTLCSGRRLPLWAKGGAAHGGRGLRLHPTQPRAALQHAARDSHQPPSRAKPEIPANLETLRTPQRFHQLTSRSKHSASVGPNSQI